MTSSAREGGATAKWLAPCPVIDVNRMLRVHGYKDPEKVRPAISKAAKLMAQRAASLAKPEGRWLHAPITALENNDLTVEGGVTLTCDAFDRLLGDASGILVFVLTMGRRFDEEVIELIEEFEPLDALFMESAGWLSIERLTRQMARDIGSELAQTGLKLGYRMGPGYSYKSDQPGSDERIMWPLEQQQELFRLFGDQELPVELMQSSAMKPKMSRSGIFGVHTLG